MSVCHEKNQLVEGFELGVGTLRRTLATVGCVLCERVGILGTASGNSLMLSQPREKSNRCLTIPPVNVTDSRWESSVQCW